MKYETLRKRLFKDKEIRNEYERLVPEYKLVEQIIQRRIKLGITQKELAERIGTKQSAVSRLESGSYNPSLFFLLKVAKALNTDLKIIL